MSDPIQSDSEVLESPVAVEVSKSQLIRDLVVFQIKLFVDGLRDVILIPVSFGAAILSLLKTGDKAGSEFYEVVAFGRQTEKSINLFEAADRIATTADAEAIPELDGLVEDVESYMKTQYEDGKFDQVRDRLQRMMDSLDKRQRSENSKDSNA
ncbi:MAG: hypothetical protein AAGL69_16825 [Pseudomonadota bacterium]